MTRLIVTGLCFCLALAASGGATAERSTSAQIRTSFGQQRAKLAARFGKTRVRQRLVTIRRGVGQGLAAVRSAARMLKHGVRPRFGRADARTSITFRQGGQDLARLELSNNLQGQRVIQIKNLRYNDSSFTQVAKGNGQWLIAKPGAKSQPHATKPLFRGPGDVLRKIERVMAAPRLPPGS